MAQLVIYDHPSWERIKYSYKNLPQSVITDIEKLERRTFPKSEAMDFGPELKKQNTELCVVLLAAAPAAAAAVPDYSKDNANRELEDRPTVAAYMLSASQRHGGAKGKGRVLLHKLCVADSLRRQGIARRLLSDLCDRSKARGCCQVDLWVDGARQPATQLYRSLHFEVVSTVADYYGLGRTGLKMVLDLTP